MQMAAGRAPGAARQMSRGHGHGHGYGFKGARVMEIADDHDSDTVRTMYTVARSTSSMCSRRRVRGGSRGLGGT